MGYEIETFDNFILLFHVLFLQIFRNERIPSYITAYLFNSSNKLVVLK